MYNTYGMTLLVGHLCLAMEPPASNGSSLNDDQNRSAWMKCLDVLRLYQESIRTARKCLRLHELSDARRWTLPTQHACQRPPPSTTQPAPSSTLNVLSPVAAQHFNPFLPHQQSYQQHSLPHSAPFQSHDDDRQQHRSRRPANAKQSADLDGRAD